MTSTNEEQLALPADSQEKDLPGLEVSAESLEDGEAILVSSVEDVYDENQLTITNKNQVTCLIFISPYINP